MASERENFELTGPKHLKKVDWKNVDHRRSVAASLVQGVYILERDRQEKREGSEALAPPWWNFFNFKLCSQLIDDADSCIFAAIYQLNPPSFNIKHSTEESPRFVVAFRGTLTKGDAFTRDVQLDLHFVRNGLHQTSRFEIALKAVRNMVSAVGNASVWLAGHSLGSAMAMLVGRNMAKKGKFLESFLFNPPYVSAPIERIQDKTLKHGIRIASSVITAGLAVSVKAKNQKNKNEDPFAALSPWVPCLFVNPKDNLCAEYIGYFQHRSAMERIGAGSIEKLAAQHSISGLFMTAIGKETEEPLHLIPSANLTINLTHCENFTEAHGLHQWWRSDLQLHSEVYKY
ncbi:hypothetical protein LguiB_028960 [Lonicera macranthoides]